jgi:hypothetical protein
MRKKSLEKERNVNEPGHFEEESLYEKKNREEREKIPVEYLGYVKKRRSSTVIRVILIWIGIVVILGFAPGISGHEYCPECGRLRSYNTMAWGKLEIRGIELTDTEWTRWYESQNPILHDHRFVLYGKGKAALFGYIPLPFTIGKDWAMPKDLILRMNELKDLFRPSKVLDIPRTLRHVSDGREWELIILPLTLGTAQEAFDWWQQKEGVLMEWGRSPLTEKLPNMYSAEAQAYIDLNTPKEEELPL